MKPLLRMCTDVNWTNCTMSGCKKEQQERRIDARSSSCKAMHANKLQELSRLDSCNSNGKLYHTQRTHQMQRLLSAISSDRGSMAWLAHNFKMIKICENGPMIGSLPNHYCAFDTVSSRKMGKSGRKWWKTFWLNCFFKWNNDESTCKYLLIIKIQCNFTRD